MDEKPMQDLFVSAVTEAEIRTGIAILPEGARRGLADAAERMPGSLFAGRVLPFDSAARLCRDRGRVPRGHPSIRAGGLSGCGHRPLAGHDGGDAQPAGLHGHRPGARNSVHGRKGARLRALHDHFAPQMPRAGTARRCRTLQSPGRSIHPCPACDGTGILLPAPRTNHHGSGNIPIGTARPSGYVSASHPPLRFRPGRSQDADPSPPVCASRHSTCSCSSPAPSPVCLTSPGWP